MDVMVSFSLNGKASYAGVMSALERVGIATSANMMFGSPETPVHGHNRFNLVLRDDAHTTQWDEYTASIPANSVYCFHTQDVTNHDRYQGFVDALLSYLPPHSPALTTHAEGLLACLCINADETMTLYDRWNRFKTLKDQDGDNPFVLYSYFQACYDLLSAENQPDRPCDGSFPRLLEEMNQTDACDGLARFAFLKALLYDFKLNNIVDAFEYYKKALIIAPYNAFFAFCCGRVMDRNNRIAQRDEILSFYQKACQNDPYFFQALYKQAQLLEEVDKDYDGAIKLYKKLRCLLHTALDERMISEAELDYYWKSTYRLVLLFDKSEQHEKTILYAEDLLLIKKQYLAKSKSKLANQINALSDDAIHRIIARAKEQRG